MDERRTVPTFLTYICLAAIFFFVMHSWHFIWDLMNAHYADNYEDNQWYFEFDIILILWQSLFISSLHFLMISAVHKDDDNMFHQIIVKRNWYKLLEFAAMIISLTVSMLIPICILSFYVEDIGSLRMFEEDSAICHYMLCNLLYVRLILIYVAYPCCIPPFLFILWSIRYSCDSRRAVEDEPDDLEESPEPKDEHLHHVLPVYTPDADLWEANVLSEEESLYETTMLLDRASTERAHYAELHRKSGRRNVFVDLEVSTSMQMAHTFMLILFFSCSFVLSFIFGHIDGDFIETHFGL